jgi:hypothetical protein
MYCGDPRPSDLPCPSFWRSVDVYSDCMVRLFESSGIPLDRIDNCGFMAGDTGTCYWRGKAGWKGMLLLSLARGGRIHVAYGDLGLFDDEDARFWAAAQELYAPAMVEGGTRSIGGWPGAGDMYGWRSQTGERTVLTLVQPTIPVGESIKLSGLSPVPSPLITADPGFEPLVFGDGSLHLAYGQVALFVSKGNKPPGVDLDEDIGLIEHASWQTSAQGTSPVTVNVRPEPRGERFLLIVEHRSENEEAVRVYPGDSFKVPYKVVLIDGEVRQDLAPMFDRKIWSGLSWWLVDVTLPACARERQFEVTCNAEALHKVTVTLAHVPKGE